MKYMQRTMIIVSFKLILLATNIIIITCGYGIHPNKKHNVLIY